MNRIFVYGFTEEDNISLSKECNLKVKLQGAMAETSIKRESVKDFIGEYLSDRGISYEDLHNFCLDFLICDSSSSVKDLKALLGDL